MFFSFISFPTAIEMASLLAISEQYLIFTRPILKIFLFPRPTRSILLLRTSSWCNPDKVVEKGAYNLSSSGHPSLCFRADCPFDFQQIHRLHFTKTSSPTAQVFAIIDFPATEPRVQHFNTVFNLLPSTSNEPTRSRLLAKSTPFLDDDDKDDVNK